MSLGVCKMRLSSLFIPYQFDTTFLVSDDIQAKILDKGLKNVFRSTLFDESLSYTNAK